MNIQIKDPVKAEQFTMIFHNRALSDCMNILFQQDKLYIQSMDSAHILIMETHLPKEWFSTYQLTDNIPITVGINTSIFHSVLKTREKGQNITINYETDKDDKLLISFSLQDEKEKKTGIFDKEFEIPLMDISQENLEITDFDTTADFSISSATLATLIGQLKAFGDKVGIECNEEKIQFSAEGIEKGRMMVPIQTEELESFEIIEDASLNMVFSLRHLHEIASYHKISKCVEVHLKNDFPIQLTYPIGEGGRITFYLAPNISDNDD